MKLFWNVAHYVPVYTSTSSVSVHVLTVNEWRRNQQFFGFYFFFKWEFFLQCFMWLYPSMLSKHELESLHRDHWRNAHTHTHTQTNMSGLGGLLMVNSALIYSCARVVREESCENAVQKTHFYFYCRENTWSNATVTTCQCEISLTRWTINQQTSVLLWSPWLLLTLAKATSCHQVVSSVSRAAKGLKMTFGAIVRQNRPGLAG